MKTEKKQQEKPMVQQLREIRDKVSAETQDMTFVQFKKYLDEQLAAVPAIFPHTPWK